MALFRTLPTPTNDFLPRLMVEVCLVLAPDVNFFLNSRKQGLPCWRSLFFFFINAGHDDKVLGDQVPKNENTGVGAPRA